MVEWNSLRRPLGGACVVVALACAGVPGVAPVAHAAAGSPFAAFAGDWRGDGEVVGSNGTRERIRCRAAYSESDGGSGLTQSIVCASPSYRIDIHSYVEASGRTVRGTWSEQTRGASGELTGTVEGGRFEGSVSGPGFTANVLLQSNGRRQTVRIVPNGSDIADVNINLVRRG